VKPSQVVWTYSGVRPLYDDGATAAHEATRDYVLTLDAPQDAPALLSIFGGKITTYRRLAEAALAELAPHLPKPDGHHAGWTGRASLPGGDFDTDGFAPLVAAICAHYPWLAPITASRLVRAYGTRIATLLDGANNLAELGELYGADLTQAELRYLANHEWATTAADVVWRRSKLGLRLTPAQIARVDEAMAALTRQAMVA
jgi:glycerol-3-phosphate dehydrogenase